MTMEDDAYRRELSERLDILKGQMASGKVHFASHLADDFRESLMRVRVDSDGLVIMDTVDARVRALAGAISHFKYREDTKSSASLREIQGIYFDMIERNFESFYRDMRKANSNPHVVGTVLSSKQDFLKDVGPQIDGFVNMIKEFWASAGPIIEIHAEDLQTMKAVFGGDMFPSYTANVASTCGMYVDTIILPCPFIRIAPLYPTLPIEKRVYYVFKHAMSLLAYKDAVLADVTPPIALVCPDRRLLQSPGDDFLKTVVEEDTAKHASLVFGCHLESFHEVMDYVRQFDTPENVAAAVTQPERMLFDVDWTEDLPSQIRQAMGELGVVTERLAGGNAGLFVAQSIFGRMFQANDLIDRARSLRGTPLVDAPTSWRYFNWKLEQDNSYATGQSSDERVTLHVTHALQSAAENKFCWLGRIQTSTLIDIRRQGAAEEIRSILSQGVKDLAESNPEEYLASTAQVMKNIDKAFERHQQQLRDLSIRKLKLFGIDVGSCLAVGGISIAAAIASNPILGAVAGIAGIAGAASVKDVIGKMRDLRSVEKRAALSPTGLFFRHANE